MTLPFVTDSHCHLDHVLKQYPDSDLEQILTHAKKVGVNRILNVCIELDKFIDIVSPAEQYDWIFASAGQHPCDCHQVVDSQLLHQAASHERVIAIGETGLDFYHDKQYVAQQEQSFIEHMRVASELKKPLIIHTRSARDETIQLLKEHADRNVGGVLHCFTENWDMAKKALDLGLYISFSGIISFKNANDLRDVAQKVPLNRLLIETDAPYLAPVPHRGKPNQPAYVTHVGHTLASLRHIDYESLVEQTNDNFDRLFLKNKKG